jgi:DNA-binding MarR family transcriptional regulator
MPDTPKPFVIDESFDPEPLREEGRGSLARLMLQVYRIFHATAHQKYAERGHGGLTLTHTSLVASLDKEGTRIVTLAERMETTKQFAGRLVQELEARGYLTTTPDPTDRRATIVRATPQGWRFLIDACAVRAEVESEFRSTLGDPQMDAFTSALQTLAHLDSPDTLPAE